MSENNANVDGADNTDAAAAGTDGTALAAAGADGANAGDGGNLNPDGGDNTALGAAAGQDGGDNGGDGGNDGGDGNGEGDNNDGDGNEFDAEKVVGEVIESIELPEGMVIADADKGAFTEVVQNHKLPAEAVKEILELQVNRAKAESETAAAARQEHIAEMKKEAMALPEETRAAASRFIDKYGSEGLKQKIGDAAYYIGNDVDIINAFAIAQKAVDGGFVDGNGAGGSQTSGADLLYS